MVNIRFKNVGQGDSIIIEWKENFNNKIGIIDCNQVAHNVNPVIEHIIETKIREIDFLFLSHPHKDHYSGFINLIKYCLSNQIKIKRFIHTANVSIDYLMAASRSVIEKKELAKLYKLVMDLRDSEDLQMNTIDDNPDTTKKLSNGFKLEFLAPSSIEIDKYIRGVDFPFDEEGSSSNPNANWLCSIIKIYNKNTSVILTSDVESQVLNRLNKKDGRLKKQKSILVQVPHHGSKKNLSKKFWTDLKKYPDTFAVISVGRNSYKHPSNEVTEFFLKHSNYLLERTDTNSTISNNVQTKSSMMNVFSKKLDINNDFKTNKDKSNELAYQVSDGKCIKI